MMFSPNSRVLEIGGGDRPIYRPNLDIRELPTVDIVCDLNDRFPIDDHTYDGVYSSYLIEHISWRKVRHFISEIFRVLRPGGKVVIVTANLLEQCKLLVNTATWTDNEICCIFGDQNYAGDDWRANAHCCGFSPESATRIFTEVGFIDVRIIEHPNCKTDMLIMATSPINANTWTTKEREAAYDKRYFNGGSNVGGYAGDGYADYPVHWCTFNHVLSRKPESVLEIGCARGYILKRLEDVGIKTQGIEISDHCILTRVSDNILKWDITDTPWPFKDKEFDLCISMATLEHIPEQKLDAVIAEITRVSRRGLHGIDLGDHDDGFDKTHCTLKSLQWWRNKFSSEQEARDKEELERGIGPPGADGLVKLNIGCFKTMFHAGWINIDIAPLTQWAANGGYIFKQLDARTIDNTIYADKSVDMIYASHFLEHLTYDDGRKFLSECRRMLKPDGVIRIAVPDMVKLIDYYHAGTITKFDEINDTATGFKTDCGKMWALLIGTDHKAVYDATTLVQLMKSVGFTEARQVAFREGDALLRSQTIDMFPDISLYVEAGA